MNRGIKKISSVLFTGKFLPVMIMMFLLSILTVGNAFIYGHNTTEKHVLANTEDEDIDDCKRPISSEEEKSSKSSSSNLTEEYLHEHDLFTHLYILIPAGINGYLHPHGFGNDHSRLHSPPPDINI